MQYVLQTQNLTKIYKNTVAINGVSINVVDKAIYGFVGRNGSGKTTFIRAVTGLIKTDGGVITLFNKTKQSDLQEARRRIAAVVETPSIYLNLNAKDNLILQCKVLGCSTSEVDEILKIVNLDNTQNKKAKDFSLGMKQRLGIAIALIGHPDFLILDEPTNGLDPEGIIEIRELILKLNQHHNITMLISSHILEELSKIATHYGFIKDGVLIKECTKETLLEEFKKKTRFVVSDTTNVSFILEETNISEYKVVSNTEFEIYQEIDIIDLGNILKKNNISIKEITNQNESLESFYINLMGGAKHV